MLNVFVVDDQISVRIGFRNLDWRQYDCALVGDAGNGLEALNMIASLKPDVVISDIRMPQMDGLELSRMIKRMYPACSIILLTGYDEFAYAQQALNIGVDYLLLKPTNFDELESTLALLKEKHAQSRESAVPAPNRENLLRDMISGKASHAEMLRMMRLEASHAGCFAVLCMLPDAPDRLEAFPEDCLTIRAVCERVLKENGVHSLCTLTAEACVFLLWQEAPLSPAHLASVGQDICSRLRHYHDLPTMAGLDVSTGEDALLTYRHAILALNNAFRVRTDVRLFSAHAANQGDLAAFNASQEGLTAAMYEGNRAETLGWFEQARALLSQMGGDYSEETCKAISTSLYSLVLDLYQTLKTSSLIADESCLQALQAFVHASIPETLPRIFAEVRRLSLRIAERIASAAHACVASDIVQYMKAHYPSADLSLDTLSGHFGLSPSHISRLIKRETGKSFVVHLTGFRIDRAKELLSDPDIRIPDIIDAVGFRDASYFIQVFKKHTGMTPMRYRQIHH